MPRHDRNTVKKKRKFKKSKRLQEEPEAASEETQDHESKRKPSAGSVAFTRRIVREQNTHEEIVRSKIMKALNGAGHWRDNPATMQRLLELKKQAESRSLK